MRSQLNAAALTLLVAGAASASLEWNIVGLPQGSDIVYADINFHQHNIEDAEALLLDISDPDSRNFGQYLDHTALEDLFVPSEESQSKVLEWLGNVGIPQSLVLLRKARAVMSIRATIDQMKKLLSADYHIAQHPHTGVQRLENTGYAIPAALKDHVHFVNWRSLDFPKSATKIRNRSNRPVQPLISSADVDVDETQDFNFKKCHFSWTPACIRNLYDIPLGNKAAPNNSLGIFGFGDLYEQNDLDRFFSKFAPFIKNGTKPIMKSIDGGLKVSEYIDGEESLDLQMSYPIVWPGNITVFQTAYNMNGGIANDLLDTFDASYCKYDGGNDPNFDPVYPIFQGFPGPAQCGTQTPPKVLSISFAEAESVTDRHYVQRQCYEWMKMALSGMTVIVASGDTGVQGDTSCDPGPQPGGSFAPLFPSSCPYVTAVGATQINFTRNGIQEVAVFDPLHHFYSGGGFSNFNAQPAYQKQAVKNYLAHHDPNYPQGTFNKSGRAYPDVALLGANVTMSDQGNFTVSGGTSAAAPMFAAMISRINDERMLAGKKSIGFLNQILYKHPEVFTDITQGSNPGCETAGFTAAKGWDPVSGMGSPKFPQLRNLLVNLP